jgi:hypothetical protein
VRRAFPHLTALLCGVAAALVVGCGDRSSLIPPNRASSMKDTLAQVQSAIESGDCAAAADGVRQLRAKAEALPPSVDSRLRIRIRQGVASLAADFGRDCAAAKVQTVQTQTETTPTVTTTTETTPTATTPTTTTPTTTTPTTTTTTPTTTTPTPTPTETSTTDNGGTPGDATP